MAHETAWVRTWPGRGLLAAVVVLLAGLLVPVVFQWHVHANAFAPLSAQWQPRVGAGTVPALLIAAAACRWAGELSLRLRWRTLLTATFVAALAWLVSLATVDGLAGIGTILDDKNEYLRTARSVHDVSALLRHFVDHISADAALSWPTHVAGHPPGALLFFVLLVRIGLGGGLAAGLVVTVIAATTPVAVVVTLRRLGCQLPARQVAPFLAFGPAAIWSAVSADAVFAAVVAWGLCALAAAATARSHMAATAWALLAGVLLGYCAFLSYGLVLVGLLAVAVLVAARRWRPLVPALAGAAAVVLVFAANGFVWWVGLARLHERYYAGIAHDRPAAYWVWGDLAALVVSAGIALGPSLGAVAARLRRRISVPSRPVVVLTAGAAACIVLADASLMSKAEVERIWLPFVPWLLLGAALLPHRWRHRLLTAQLVLTIVVQSLLVTRW